MASKKPTKKPYLPVEIWFSIIELVILDDFTHVVKLYEFFPTYDDWIANLVCKHWLPKIHVYTEFRWPWILEFEKLLPDGETVLLSGDPSPEWMDRTMRESSQVPNCIEMLVVGGKELHKFDGLDKVYLDCGEYNNKKGLVQYQVK